MNEERIKKLKKGLKLAFKGRDIIQKIIHGQDFEEEWGTVEYFRLVTFAEMKLPLGKIVYKMSHGNKKKTNRRIQIAEELTQAYRELKEEREG